MALKYEETLEDKLTITRNPFLAAAILAVVCTIAAGIILKVMGARSLEVVLLLQVFAGSFLFILFWRWFADTRIGGFVINVMFFWNMSRFRR